MTTTPGRVAMIDLAQAERLVVRQATTMSDELLIATSHYDEVWGNTLTSGNFVLGQPFVGEEEMLIVRAEYFPLRGNISGREGVKIMQNCGFRPPTLREMLAFGRQNGSTQWEYVIGANLHYRVPSDPCYGVALAIWSHGGRRGLTIASMYNGMMHAWPCNPHYLWVPLS